MNFESFSKLVDSEFLRSNRRFFKILYDDDDALIKF